MNANTRGVFRAATSIAGLAALGISTAGTASAAPAAHHRSTATPGTHSFFGSQPSAHGQRTDRSAPHSFEMPRMAAPTDEPRIPGRRGGSDHNDSQGRTRCNDNTADDRHDPRTHGRYRDGYRSDDFNCNDDYAYDYNADGDYVYDSTDEHHDYDRDDHTGDDRTGDFQVKHDKDIEDGSKRPQHCPSYHYNDYGSYCAYSLYPHGYNCDSDDDKGCDHINKQSSFPLVTGYSDGSALSSGDRPRRPGRHRALP